MYEIPKGPDVVTGMLTDAILENNTVSCAHIFSFWQTLRYMASPEYFRQAIRPLPPRALADCGLQFLRRPHTLGLTSPLLGLELEFRQRYYHEHVKARQFRLPDRDWQRLLVAKDVWVRALTYTSFPERCDRAWIAALLNDLRRRASPLPGDEVRRLLRQLDDKQFAVREAATQELIRLGDTVVPALRTALEQPLSAEAQRRVRLVLDEQARQADNPEHRRIVSHFAWRNTPQDREVLEALAAGDPRCRLAQDARKALDELKRKPR
jgi:hypothetical protein